MNDESHTIQGVSKKTEPMVIKQNYWTIKDEDSELWDFVHSYTYLLRVLEGLEAIPVKFRKIMNEL